ncbi:MAG: metallophosphoesterase, partial [Sphingobacteriaceae bacterium]
LLLSHDPSHWQAQVLPEYPQIDMMFSGHTHGMQFGVRLEHFQWSPVQYIYKEWAGHYQQNNQQLYVNTGYGFLGYPGRVGILPEITIFELKSDINPNLTKNS